MRIRAFQDADQSAVIALWAKVLADSAPHNDPRLSLQKKLDVDPDLLLIAEDAGQIIGAAMGGYDGHRGWIYSVAVEPNIRRQGIGSALIQALEALLKQRGCLKVNLQVRSSNSGVIPFYESLGFHVEEHVSLGKRLYASAADLSPLNNDEARHASQGQ